MNIWRARTFALVLVAVAVTACSGDEAGPTLPDAPSSDVVFAPNPPDAPTAPSFSGELTDGTAVEASEVWTDRPVVLLFTASWCGRCAEFHRQVADTVDTYDGDIALIALVDGTDDGIDDYADEMAGAGTVVVVDTEVWNAYAAEEPPLVALVGPGGALLRGWPGSVDQEVLAAQLDGLFLERSEDG